MKRIVVFIIFLISVLAHAEQHVSVSMTRLISNGESYGGKKIVTVGYAHVTSNKSVICAYKDDFLYGNGKNCFILDVELNASKKWSLLSDSYVIVRASFANLPDGYESVVSGIFKDVSEVSPALEAKP